ncbi:MAG: type II toxin-antitoxin system ParD family antitoxin [bacterium]|nr:type II toxin-antitoxin system ParD family antitoxin [bacterium]
MSTLSVPLPPHLEEFVSEQVKRGLAPNKAEVVRKALRLLREEEAVMAVLRAEKEPILRGDLRKLAKEIK